MTDLPEIDTIYVNIFCLRKPYSGRYFLNEKEAGGCVKFVRADRAALAPVDGNTSDGYHTFNELYEHRHALFLTICKIYKDRAWKSKFHSDGTMFDGWFIAGIATTDGQATYHLPLRLWDDFTVDELPMSPPWDGHTPDDVINRIKNIAARGFGVPEGYVLVPIDLLHKAKVLINFHVKRGACIDINDKLFNEGEIYSELNKLWAQALAKDAPKKEGV